MKKLLTMTAVAVFLLSGPAFAGDRSDRWGKSGVGAGAAAGALLAGPPGALLGAGFGGFLGERLARARDASELETELAIARSDLGDVRESLQRSRQHVTGLRADLADRDQRIAELENARRSSIGLESEILFRTGESTLGPGTERRLDGLAAVLRDNPDTRIRLDAHADPRGGPDSNLALSRERARSVGEALTVRGIDPARIDIHAHGDELSEAAAGDLDAYALERRVRIRLEGDASEARVANSD